jgi:hypothetical protein
MNGPAIPPIPATAQNRTIRFSLDESDVFLCRLIALAHNRMAMGIVLLCSLFVALQVMNGQEVSSHPLGFRIFCFILAFTVLALIQVALNVGVIAARTMFQKNPGVVGQHEFEIAAEGLIERTDLNQTVNRWPGILRTRCRRGFLFIWVAGNQVHYIPQNSFSSMAAFEEFHDEIKKRVDAAVHDDP